MLLRLSIISALLVGCIEQKQSSVVFQSLTTEKVVSHEFGLQGLSADVVFSTSSREDELGRTKQWHYVSNGISKDLEELVINVGRGLKQEVQDLGADVKSLSKNGRKDSFRFNTVSYVDGPIKGRIRVTGALGQERTTIDVYLVED